MWLPGPGAGLSLLGIEMGEWFKFLGLGSRRDLFYLPPITLGLMLAIWTMTWPQNDWRAWTMRLLAILVSLLAFPAVEDIIGPVREQYTLRVLLIGVVLIVAVFSGLWRPQGRQLILPWTLLTLLGFVGALLPTWQYLAIRPFTSELFGVSLGIGLGVWLNLVGNLLVTGVGLSEITAVNPETQKHLGKTKM